MRPRRSYTRIHPGRRNTVGWWSATGPVWVADGIVESLRANDSAGVVALFADGLVYDDRRHLGGGTVASRQGVPVSIERFCISYSRFDNTTLAVRGERLVLVATRFSDSPVTRRVFAPLRARRRGPRSLYEGRFDEDDFLSAYVELDRRYYPARVWNSQMVEGQTRVGSRVLGRRDIEMVRRFSTRTSAGSHRRHR